MANLDAERVRFRKELEEMGLPRVRAALESGLWGERNWRLGEALEWIALEEAANADFQRLVETKMGTGVLKAARDANVIAQQALDVAKETRTSTKAIATATRITAIAAAASALFALLTYLATR